MSGALPAATALSLVRRAARTQHHELHNGGIIEKVGLSTHRPGAIQKLNAPGGEPRDGAHNIDRGQDYSTRRKRSSAENP
jgi:hypothetical protein